MMIYIAASRNVHVYDYVVRHGLDKDRVRAITRPEQLRGLTGGNLYALPTFKFNDEAQLISEIAKDRFIRLINIAESCKKEELLKMEQSHDHQ
jgi:hypothetical protein